MKLVSKVRILKSNYIFYTKNGLKSIQKPKKYLYIEVCYMIT